MMTNEIVKTTSHIFSLIPLPFINISLQLGKFTALQKYRTSGRC